MARKSTPPRPSKPPMTQATAAKMAMAEGKAGKAKGKGGKKKAGAKPC